MATDTELIKLPLSLGLKINGILKEKIGFVPRENKVGIMSFEFTREELELIDKLSFENPVRGEIEGIELLPNLRTLVIKSDGNTAYKQDKNISSISDKDSLCIYKCKNLENLSIENQAKLSFIDVSQMKKLHILTVTRNARLKEISGLESTTELWQLDCYGNESLMQTGDLNKVIMQNEELTDLNLDVLLFPDAMGFDIRSGEINEGTLKRFENMNVSWHEILSSLKSIKIDNSQMMQMHQKACKALEDYVPKHCESRTAVIGIEQYLAENVKYDDASLKNNHSHSYDDSITIGPIGGANGAYNAFTYGTCVCEGYTRAMQYLLRLKGIKSHNVHCISGEDKLHMSTDKQDDMYKTYDLPDDGYHSIISIDDVDYLYDDPCWNAGRYQRGDNSMPWTLLTKEEISRDHTLSFNERNIDNNILNVPRSTIQIAMQRIANYRQERRKQQEIFSEQEIGKSTVNVSRTEKDNAKERYQRNMQERKIEKRTNPQELDTYNHNGSHGGTNDGR